MRASVQGPVSGSRTLLLCLLLDFTKSVKASHDARLDVLVGDLLVVVVGAAAGRVHRRGRHGVEGEDELLPVAHAGRLGVVAGYTCGTHTRSEERR